MSLWRRFASQFVTPVDRPREVTLDALLDETPATPELEHADQHRAALRLVHRTLLAESLKDPAVRDVGAINLGLELRSILQPSAPASHLLREVPPVGIRYAAPVIPGRAP